jgi:hypothetical protein
LFSEVSKGDEIMPAIKTLQLLAHGDSYRSSNLTQQPPDSLIRASSLNSNKNPLEKNLTHSKSLRILSTRTNSEQSYEKKLDSLEKATDESEQKDETDS